MGGFTNASRVAAGWVACVGLLCGATAWGQIYRPTYSPPPVAPWGPNDGWERSRTPATPLPWGGLREGERNGSGEVDTAAPRWPDGSVPRRSDDNWAQTASRQTEVPTRFPQDLESGYPPNLPLAVEDDQLLFEGPHLTSFKSGFFQKASLSGTWLAGNQAANGLGIVETEVFLTVAVPMPRREWPMLITPYFQLRTLDGPLTPDLPPDLYETYVDFMWVPKITSRLLGILAVAPAVYSDFEAGSPNGFRWTGKALLRWDIQPDQLQLMGGVLYLNREDIRVLPAGGVIWRPNPDADYELIFPRPKLGRRLRFTNDSEDWIYLAGEFGGNSFAITREDGSPDVATLRDWRVMLGVERRRNGGAGYRFEVGYVFSRSVEYLHSSTPDFYPDNTLMVRLVGAF
ncbi:MAG: hypothetical protein U0935_14290 [Pirellulales bacterium]